MYYSNGNYEAFARAKKPADVEKKSAYIVGAGLAALSTACFLIRDGQMEGSKIHIFEETDEAGGALDGNKEPVGYSMRGGREMENHFECLWDLFRSIPSLEHPDYSVLDEFYWLNKEDPNFSLERATVKCGQDAHTDGKFGLSDKAAMEIMKLFLATDEELYDKTIEQVFDQEVLGSNFWMYWRTMFAFENWHSALEMKRYIQRFIHHIGGLPDFSALKFTKFNQYESLVKPMLAYLKGHGVVVHFNCRVTNVVFDLSGGKKVATKLEYTEKGEPKSIDLTINDLVFVTNGSCTENSSLGGPNEVPVLNTTPGGCWTLWKNIAKQDPAFGRPDKFCSDITKTSWESATVTTLDDKIPAYIEKICKRDPFSGKTVTGGIVTAMDSSWLMSWTVNRQPQFKGQSKKQTCVWVYGLFNDKPGDYIKKNMQDCTGIEITEEWLYQIGVPTDQIHDLATNSAICIPAKMPYITAFFMPRTAGDRPLVVPDGSVNFAFIGQFCETPRDCVFTTEYSVRTAMEAVYTLLNVDRGVPEVFDSCFDIRCLLAASVRLLDGRKPIDMKLPFFINIVEKQMLKKIKDTQIEQLLEKYGVI